MEHLEKTIVKDSVRRLHEVKNFIDTEYEDEDGEDISEELQSIIGNLRELLVDHEVTQ